MSSTARADRAAAWGSIVAVCFRCPPLEYTDARRSVPPFRRVPVAVSFAGEMLCPAHAVEAVGEFGLTLDEAITGRRST